MTRRRTALLALFTILVTQTVTMVPAQAARACLGKKATIVGTKGNDRLRGTPGADVIVGRGGRDRIHGRGGKDRICGAGGRDTLKGGPGSDRVAGNGGPDILWGAGGNDVLAAGKGGFHSFYPGGGKDIVRGARNVFDDVDYFNSPRGVNVDLAAGTATGFGSDRLRRIDDAYGSKFDDTLRGTGVDNVLTGRGGNDTISGRGNSRQIFSPDFLEGGPGNDDLDGGAGFDVGDYRFAKRRVVVDLQAGTAVGQGNDSLASIEEIDGSRFADRLTGNGGNNVFQGGAGKDTMSGAGGTDTIVHFSSRRGVRVNLSAGTSSTGAGTDSLNSIENVYGSFSKDRLRGDGNANSIRAFAGNDTLLGLGGDDVLRGHSGKDTINGGAGNDACAGETETNCERNASARKSSRLTERVWFAIQGRLKRGLSR